MKMNPSILLGKSIPDLYNGETLGELLAVSFKKFASNCAIRFKDEEISYQALDEISNGIAQQLINNGIKAGSTIGVYFKRGNQLLAIVCGIIKAGCTYVPVDAEMPLERANVVFTEAEVSAYFSEINIVEGVLRLLPANDLISHFEPIKVSNEDYAYYLYTSGSTGKPKGIPISHRQICHLIRSEQEVLGIRADDIVYQGFSVSFDMWCEETWISLFAGASLLVADTTTAKSLDELHLFLLKNKVTVLHAVPSLLAVLDIKAAKYLRIINAGGEACPVSVMEKWAAFDLRFYNSYGPTETTVTSSIALLKPGDAIDIGTPLPNYNYAVITENNTIAEKGTEGELIISGYGVGTKYLKLPELSAQKFLSNPFIQEGLPGTTIYKTGDLVVMTEEGKVAFHGRIDDQVKIRGFRIELGEIEHSLLSLTGINTAVVVLKKNNLQEDELVAYYKPEKTFEFTDAMLRNHLSERLPSYMVPSIYVLIESWPTLASGKIDRKSLPIPAILSQRINAEKPTYTGLTTEQKITAAFKYFFPDKAISNDQDFFYDLGGHSLVAAMLVSELRNNAGLSQLSIRDIYEARTIGKFIACAENKSSIKAEKTPFKRVSNRSFVWCTIAQALSMPIIFGFFSAQLYIPYLGYYYAQVEWENYLLSFGVAIALYCFITPLMLLVTLFSKMLVIGKYKPGNYPIWGSYYFRCWFVSMIKKLNNFNYLNNTPLYPMYLKAMGVHIGGQNQLSVLDFEAPDLIEIGEGTNIGSGVVLNNIVYENGEMRVGKIKIGKNCYVGTSCVIGIDAAMEDFSELKDLSYLSANSVLKKGVIAFGSPAEPQSIKEAAQMQTPIYPPKHKVLQYTFIYSVLLLLLHFALMIPFFPGLFTLYELDQLAGDYEFYYLFLTPLLALFYVLIFIFQTSLITRLLMRNVKEGKYNVYSHVFLRKWISDQLYSISLVVLHPLYASVFVRQYFKLLGAKVGLRAEISTAGNITPHLLELDAETFIADSVNLGEADIRESSLMLAKTQIGERTFIGNSALVPQGSNLPSKMLLGVLSVPPDAEKLAAQPGNDWFGSPALAIPKRQSSQLFDETLTYKPSKKQILYRGSVESIRILLPLAFILSSSWLFISYIHNVVVDYPWWVFIIALPFYFAGFIAIPGFILVVILKWLLVGKYTAKEMPMWSLPVWLSEAVTSMYESIAVPYLLDYLQGTIFLPWLLRFLGVKTGKRNVFYTTDFTEYDVITIGDDVALNHQCGPQTHLFEDRIMKIGNIEIGARSSIGARSIILYHTTLGEDVQIEPLSLVMKGENLQGNTIYKGCPVQ